MNTDNRAELQTLIGDDYQLQWIIGHGGMSTVWLADDVANDREVAIKVLRPEFTDNDEFLTRFRNEALAAEDIDSPNVVATYDYREVPTEDGLDMCFIVMEYVRGESLADLIAREGQLDEELALEVLGQAAHGLAAIHRMGLVHRDIKPGNLMITQNGSIKITDFGIAKAASAVPLTRTGMVVGTAQYVSPEQAQGFEVTSASDIYSLGVAGYEMLSGRRPFTGDSSVSVALAHVSNEAPPLSTSISAPTRELIGIALRKDPATRFADGTEFEDAVNAAKAGERPTTTATTTRKVAAEPAPVDSTAMLDPVTEGTTIAPATGYDEAYNAGYDAGYSSSHDSRDAEASAKSGGSGFGTGVIIALLVLMLSAAGIWAFMSGALSGLFGDSEDTSESSTTSSTPETTQTVETITETRAPSPTPSSTPERPTPEEPSTLFNSPEEPTPEPVQPVQPEQPVQPVQPPNPAPQPTPPPAPAPQPEPLIPPIPLDGLPALPFP